MANIGRVSQVKAAYEKVFNQSIEAEDAVKKFDELICAFEAYPSESEDAKRIRLKEIEGYEDYENIGRWLFEFDPTIFPTNLYSTYERAFYIVSKSGANISESKTVTPNDTMASDSSSQNSQTEDVSQIQTNQEESKMNDEQKEMTTPETNSNFEDLRAKFGSGSTPAGDLVNNDATNVTSVSEDVKKAANEVIAKTQSERIQYTRETKITQALITEVLRSEKAVAGKEAKGTVSNPRKCYEKFCANTGYDDSTGEPVFTKLAPGESTQKAKEMLNILKKAMEDPNFEVDVYFGVKDEPTVSIKGYNIRTPDGKEETVSVSDMTKILLSRTIGVLNFETVPGAQVAVEGARISGKRRAKKPYTVRIANRQTLIADKSASVNIKTKTPNIDDQQGGFKSAISIKFKGDKLTAGGEPKIMTYRIPLNVKQYKYEVMSQYSELIKRGIGNQKAAVDINNDGVIDELAKSIANILAVTSVSTDGAKVIDSKVLDSIGEVRTRVAEQSANAQKEQLENLDI